MRTRAAWARFAAAGTAAAVAYFVATPAHPLVQTALYLGVGAAATAAIVAGTRRQRPAGPGAGTCWRPGWGPGSAAT